LTQALTKSIKGIPFVGFYSPIALREGALTPFLNPSTKIKKPLIEAQNNPKYSTYLSSYCEDILLFNTEYSENLHGICIY
jgi:hypothetical protein